MLRSFREVLLQKEQNIDAIYYAHGGKRLLAERGIEHRTGIPLLHFRAGVFRKTLHPTQLSYWTNPRNLEFISKRR